MSASRKRGRSSALLVAGGALFVLAVGAGCGSEASSSPPATKAQPAQPSSLDIEAIGVHAGSLDTFGLDNKGNYSCPVDPQTVAWNRGGTAPGDAGLVLVIGSAQGAFQRLRDLKPGDPIVITRTDGSRITYTIIGSGSTASSSSQMQLSSCGTGATANAYAQLASP